MTAPHGRPYACGHGAGELDRLLFQGAFYEDITRAFLEGAGLRPGMRVLDIGCGTGDVSLLAADIVGRTGAVLGVDRAPEALALASSRAAARVERNVGFHLGDAESLDSPDPFDALIGRFVLMHQPEPAMVLRATARHVRRGGVVAILESHLAASLPGVHSWPPAPTYDQVLRWIVATLEAAGAHTDMGLRLGRVFADAGLPAPGLCLQARVEGGADAAIYRYIAESLRSLLPLAERHGIVRLSPAEVDTLEHRLRAEALESGGVLTSPLVVGARCRLPG